MTGINPSEYPFYEAYLDRPHFKALVRTPHAPGNSFAGSMRFLASSPETAVRAAMEGCKREQTVEVRDCQLHSLGNVYVSRFDEDQLRRAMAVYKKKREFTLADLEPTAFERLTAPAPVRAVQQAAPHTGSYCYRVKSNEMFELRGEACASDAFQLPSTDYQKWRTSKTTFKVEFERSQRTTAVK